MIPGAFLLDKNEDQRLLKTEAAQSGRIYLQSISSMLPPLILKPAPGETILDIAASPGSKTSQIAAMMKNQGHIDAVEPDFIRLERLKHNMELLGASIITCHQSEGQKFTPDRPAFYDRILADVPCSGEGRFNIHDKASYLNWKASELSRFSRLQKKLLVSAIQALKPGGTLVYSTCTLNPLENEEVVQSVIEEPALKIKLQEIDPVYHQFREKIRPFQEYNGRIFSKEVRKCLKILPSENLEGFFICLFKKQAD
jgi:16S rRNA (cytosine1407-C5)-methyltransferase